MSTDPQRRGGAESQTAELEREAGELRPATAGDHARPNTAIEDTAIEDTTIEDTTIEDTTIEDTARTATGPADPNPAVDPSRFGPPGSPVNRATPFYFGFVGAAGALTAYWLLNLLPQLSSVLTLIIVALFLALGLEPVVAWLEGRGLRRGLAVTAVFIGVIALFTGFGWAVVPAAVEQTTQLTAAAPDLVENVQNAQWVQRLDREYRVIDTITTQLQQRLASGQTVMQLFGGIYGAGAKVVSGAFSAFTVLVLTLYFTASLRSMREAAYRLVPASRRPRVKLLADEILRRIGGYIAGQVGVATINGVFTYILLMIMGLPYPLLLAIIVSIFGLIPLVGATIGAVVVVIVALFHSWQYALVALTYYVIYQQVENYVIAPRIMARTVSVPGAVAVIAALAGGTLLGVVGALIAIPVAAGALLLVQEVLIPRQAQH
jgi:predicted PurR-regulated permease PerM